MEYYTFDFYDDRKKVSEVATAIAEFMRGQL